MRKTLALILALCLCVGLFGCSKKKANEFTNPGEEQVRTFLEAVNTYNRTQVLSCVPPECVSIYGNIFDSDEEMQVASCSVKVYYTGKLSQSEISDVADEYLHETGIVMQIEEAHRYNWEAESIFIDNDEYHTSKADSQEFFALSVKIRGQWYAISESL